MAEPVVIGDCTLYLGDCLTVMMTLPPQPAGIADCLVTDPPYGVEFSGKLAVQRDGSNKKVGGGYVSLTDTPEVVRTRVVPAVGMALRHVTRGAVTPGTRCMFMYPASDDVGCFYSAAGTGKGRWGFSCSQPILYYGKCPYNHLGSRPNSMGQSYPNDANETGHPCAKPLPIVKWLVDRVSLRGEIVLDPFMGSGTTGVACVKLGRKFIGIEIEERYFNIAVKRITDAYRQGDMFRDAKASNPKASQLPLLREGV